MRTRAVSGIDRRCCPGCGFVHFPEAKVAVGVAVVSAGRLLLVRRVMTPYVGRWTPPGGFVDAGEDPRVAAAVRRWRRAVEVSGLVDLVVDPGAGAAVFLVYDGTHVGGEPRPCRRG